jgi:hypothetical protein
MTVGRGDIAPRLPQGPVEIIGLFQTTLTHRSPFPPETPRIGSNHVKQPIRNPLKKRDFFSSPDQTI